MKRITLRKNILRSLLSLVLFLGLCIALFGYYVVKKHIVGKAQGEVVNNLQMAHKVYSGQLQEMEYIFPLLSEDVELDLIKDKVGLDYLLRVNPNQIEQVKSEIVRKSYRERSSLGSMRVIAESELKNLGQSIYENSLIEIKPTLKSRPSDREALKSAMSIEYAYPRLDHKGNVVDVLYGGKIINNNFTMIDEISNSIFGNKIYNSKPEGTVTVFLNDIRIATNVLDDNNNRAVGTIVSKVVYDAVIDKGEKWLDRAFVVTDWYLTAYEPIRNIDGDIIGMLYVGILEKPFKDMERRLLLVLVLIIFLVSILAAGFSYLISSSIAKPLTEFLYGIENLSRGTSMKKINVDKNIEEFSGLALSFNKMAEELKSREDSLALSNEKLSRLNKSYLDLIGFVSHELKGILASAMLNVYSVKDGFLGLTNFKQRKALDSVARNLEHLSGTVRNFLNLSRIEKGDFDLNKTEFMFKEDIADETVEAFLKQALEKQIRINNKMDNNIKVRADLDHIKVVFNNLISNAIKYGSREGEINIFSKESETEVLVEIYNDGTPLNEDDLKKLFKRFSRVMNSESRKEKGTGLGLFIAAQIINNHNGSIWAEPRERGNAFIFSIPKGG